MSADRETGHEMTNTDIALLLADAADGVEIGIAPTQAVIRGGRRRRARRWAVAAGAALAIVGTTGTVALAGLPGGDGHRVAATQPPTTLPNSFQAEPHNTTLASGFEDGKAWNVSVDVWGAPRNAAEAQAQLTVMTEYGEYPGEISEASDLIGKSAIFVSKSYDGKASMMIHQMLSKGDRQRGTDLVSGASGLKSSSEPARLVVGRIAKSAQQVTCTWKDGTSTVLHRDPANTIVNNTLLQGIRPAEGSPDAWFVCLAPKGTSYDKAEVTG
ncbi:hypothetical protein GCM10022403_063030 [Streptomyces coacervatus]|uniref:Uncharacterized protein n=1 Tax=Streptomyces coacervatus TaxID=647381 RepID=A0ABP7IL62_9ACTN|nr:hypothetical protein [Streptomyces coacervatus]MDF2268889.1 hypothetical protein [Streptomyces coacervatus]